MALSEHIVRGRWADVREPTEQELRATTVLSLPLVEASAKIRTGPPLDDEEDYALPVWAGVIPLRLEAGEPIKDPRLPEGIERAGIRAEVTSVRFPSHRITQCIRILLRSA